MTAEKLLNPRFEVIENYPNSTYKIGDILEKIDEGFCNYQNNENPNLQLIGYPENYPALFRKLNWWEHRKEEDMPKKLKSLIDKEEENPEIYDIVKWDMTNMMGFINLEKRSVCDLLIFNPEYSYIPID